MHPGDGSDVQDLHQEPESNQQCGRYEGNSNEDNEEDHSLDAIAGIGDQERAHHCSDGSAGPETRNLREWIPDNLAHHRHNAANQIEEDESAGTHRVFDFAAEGPEVNHVANDVHPAGMHEHGGEDRDPAVSMDDANRHDRPGPNEAVAVNQLFQKNIGIQDDDGDGSQRKTPQGPRGVTEWNESAHLHSALAEEDSDSVGDGAFDCANDRHLEP